MLEKASEAGELNINENIIGERKMQRKEFKPCVICGRGMMHSGNVVFYKVSIAKVIINLPAVQRQHGLEMMLGGSGKLAEVMGPNEPLAYGDSVVYTGLICDHCASGASQVALMFDKLIPDKAKGE
jgi:hypothetical protein